MKDEDFLKHGLTLLPGSVMVVGPTGLFSIEVRDGKAEKFTLRGCNFYGPGCREPELMAVRDLAYDRFNEFGERIPEE